MYRLIKEVHWSGPAAPFEVVGVQPVAVVNNGDGTYTITWNAPVVVTFASPEANLLLYSPVTDSQWEQVVWNNAATASLTTIVSAGFGAADCDQIVLLGPLLNAHPVTGTFPASTPPLSF